MNKSIPGAVGIGFLCGCCYIAAIKIVILIATGVAVGGTGLLALVVAVIGGIVWYCNDEEGITLWCCIGSAAVGGILGLIAVSTM